MENCPHCGKSRFGDDNTCWFCGKDVNAPVSTNLEEHKETGGLHFETLVPPEQNYSKKMTYGLSDESASRDRAAGIQNYGLSDESASRDRAAGAQNYGLSDESASRDRAAGIQNYGLSDESASRDRAAGVQNYGLSDESASRDRAAGVQNYGLSDESDSRDKSSRVHAYGLREEIDGASALESPPPPVKPKGEQPKPRPRMPAPPVTTTKKGPGAAIAGSIGIFVIASIFIAVLQSRSKPRSRNVVKKEEIRKKLQENLEKRKTRAITDKKALVEKNNSNDKRLEEHVQNCIKKSYRLSCRRALLKLKTLDRTEATAKKILNVARAGCKKGYVESCMDLCDEARKRDKFTAEDKDYYCSYGCEVAGNAGMCEKLAFAKLRGEGHLVDESAAKRHVTGLCSNLSAGCWNEAEIAEIIVWNRVDEKSPRSASEKDIWIGPAILRNQSKGFKDLLKTPKSRDSHLKGIKIKSTYFRELISKKSISRQKDPEKPARYEQIHFYLHNGSCTDAVVNLTLEWVLNGKMPAKTLKNPKVCYPGPSGEVCQNYTIAEGQNPVSSISVKLPANISSHVFIEMDSNFIGPDAALYKKIKFIGKNILWSKGKTCPKPDLKALLALKGPYKYIGDIYKKGCELQKSKKPDYMLCKYMEKIGRHKKEDLRTMCNNRNLHPSGYIEGACRRLKARFKEEIKEEKTAEISEPAFDVAPSGGAGIAISSGTSIKIGSSSSITIKGGSKNLRINGKTGKEAEKELMKLMKKQGINVNNLHKNQIIIDGNIKKQ
ncbi:hypothetical protein KKF34_05440 [Myxococcota bacterium]|nr:hypothetical protein [Myxococcota bacterium]MBU1379607.1 hypothetical protein [Myxococcota bacterium]MBU1496304.1 hypothetical protein [Myxococcota bacterium]